MARPSQVLDSNALSNAVCVRLGQLKEELVDIGAQPVGVGDLVSAAGSDQQFMFMLACRLKHRVFRVLEVAKTAFEAATQIGV